MKNFLFIEQLLLYLTETARLDLELACEIVSRITVDLPPDANVPELVARHGSELHTMYNRIREITWPLFTKPHSPTYSRWRPIATAMFLNMVSNYHVTGESH